MNEEELNNNIEITSVEKTPILVYLDLFVIVMCLVLCGLIIYGIYIFDQDKAACVLSPIEYYQEKNDLMCLCAKEGSPTVFPPGYNYELNLS